MKEEHAKKEEEQKRKELEALQKQKALEADPAYQARQREKLLFENYEIFDQVIKPKSRHRLFMILNRIKKQKRLNDDDLVWLNSEGSQYYTYKVRLAYHRIEANYFLNEFKNNRNDLWNAINASSQLRKCKASEEAELLLKDIKVEQNKNKKMISAFFTTLGGVRRDLKKSKLAIEHGQRAHELTPNEYRPCTLLGAIYMETGEYSSGHEWYQKARDRGAPDQSIQSELKSIILKLDKTKRNKMIDGLIKLDHSTYIWLEQYKNVKQTRSKLRN